MQIELLLLLLVVVENVKVAQTQEEVFIAPAQFVLYRVYNDTKLACETTWRLVQVLQHDALKLHAGAVYKNYKGN